MTWDPPTNIDGSDIDYYIIMYNIPLQGTQSVVNETSAISVLRILNCRGDDTIQVTAVNRFGCVGQNSLEIRPNLLDNGARTTGSITSAPIRSTSASGKD